MKKEKLNETYSAEISFNFLLQIQFIKLPSICLNSYPKKIIIKSNYCYIMIFFCLKSFDYFLYNFLKKLEEIENNQRYFHAIGIKN